MIFRTHNTHRARLIALVVKDACCPKGVSYGSWYSVLKIVSCIKSRTGVIFKRYICNYYSITKATMEVADGITCPTEYSSILLNMPGHLSDVGKCRTIWSLYDQ